MALAILHRYTASLSMQMRFESYSVQEDFQ